MASLCLITVVEVCNFHQRLPWCAGRDLNPEPVD